MMTIGSNRRLLSMSTILLPLLATIVLLASSTTTNAAFLSSQLPLKALSITPLDYNGRESTPQQRIPLSDYDTITAVFSRSVIALGSDFGGVSSSSNDDDGGGLPLPADKIPLLLTQADGTPLGLQYRMRYPTTFIARIDLADNARWPKDLDLNVRINPALHTWDGVALTTTTTTTTTTDADAGTAGVMEMHYSTPGLEGHLQRIDSFRALQLTDGLWSERYGDGDDRRLPECPPDGRMIVTFNYPVLLSVVQRVLRVEMGEKRDRGDDGTTGTIADGVTLDIRSCRGHTVTGEGDDTLTTCIEVAPAASSLQVDGRYRLVLPAGTRYNHECGALRQSIEIPFSGLKPFTFAFQWVWQYTRRWHLYLRHGLADAWRSDVGLQRLAQFFVLRNEKTGMALPYQLSLINRATLQITADFDLQESYTLSMNEQNVDGDGDVPRDGYDLPLRQHTSRFQIEARDNYMVQGQQQSVVFESKVANAVTHWHAFTRVAPGSNDSGRQRHRQTIRSLDTLEHIREVMKLRYSPWLPSTSTSSLTSPIIGTMSPAMPSPPQMLSIDTSSADLMWRQQYTTYNCALRDVQQCPHNQQYPSDASLIQRTDIGVVAIYRVPDRTLTLQLTRYSTNAVLDNAEVTLIETTPNNRGGNGNGDGDVRIIATLFTDDNGRVDYDFTTNTMNTNGDDDIMNDDVTGGDIFMPSPAPSPFFVMNRQYSIYVTTTTTGGGGDDSGSDEEPMERAILDNISIYTGVPPPSLSSSSSSSSWTTTVGGGGVGQQSDTGMLITDRGMYKPGQSIHIIVFLRRLSVDAQWSLSESDNDVDDADLSAYHIVARFPQSGGDGRIHEFRQSLSSTSSSTSTSSKGSSSTVKYDREYGTASMTIDIPHNVQYTTVIITLERVMMMPTTIPPSTTTSSSSSSGGGTFDMIPPPPPPSSPPSSPPLLPVSVVASTSILIADPRRPTVTIDFTLLPEDSSSSSSSSSTNDDASPSPSPSPSPSITTGIYRPGHRRQALATLTTGTGLPVAQAELGVRWEIERVSSRPRLPVWLSSRSSSSNGGGADDDDDDDADDGPRIETGIVQVITDDAGQALVDVDLESWSSYSILPDYVLRMTVVWLGPTGELVDSTIHMDVRESSWLLQVETTVPEPLPGFPFQIRVGITDVVHRDDNNNNSNDAVGAGAGGAGGDVMDVTVRMALYEWRDGNELGDMIVDATTGGGGGVCEAIADGARSAQCEFTLPALEQYILMSETRDENDVVVRHQRVLGQSSSAWSKNPLQRFDRVSMRLDRAAYVVGDVALVRFRNPFSRTRIMMLWGNALSTQTKHVDVVEQGDVELSLPIGDECRGSCRVVIAMTVPRQGDESTTGGGGGVTATQLPVDIPISALFDLDAPRIITEQLLIHVPDTDRSIDISLTLDSDIVEPGTTVKLNVAVTDPASSTGDGNGNGDGDDVDGLPSVIHIFAVDQAFLDLKPHPLVDVDEHFEIQMPGDFQIHQTYDSLVNADGYHRSADVGQRRQSLDPLVQPQWRLQPSSWWMPQQTYWSDTTLSPSLRCLMQRWCNDDNTPYVDSTDDAYLQTQTTRVTSFPPFRNIEDLSKIEAGGNNGAGGAGGEGGNMPPPPMAVAEASMDMGMADADGGSMIAAAPTPTTMENGNRAPSPSPTTSTTPTLPVRTNFETAPLFLGTIRLDNGRGVFDFKLPDNSGRFSLRAYGCDRRHRFGSVETSVISRRRITLESMLPRHARSGDTFDAGVTVTHSDPSFDGALTVVCQSDQSDVLDVTETRVTRDFRGIGPHRVTFPMMVDVIGKATLTCSVRDSGDGNGGMGRPQIDAISAVLETKAVQESVVVATSMAVSGNDDADVNDDEVFDWPEGIAFPNAVRGTGVLNITAGVGRYPAVETMAKVVLAPQMWSDSGDRLVTQAYMRVAFVPYTSSDSDSDASTSTSTSVLSSSSAFRGSTSVSRFITTDHWQHLMSELTRHTDQRLGLFYSTSSLHSYSLPSIHLNVWGLYVYSRLRDTLPATATSATSLETITALSTIWSRVTTSELWRMVRDARRWGSGEGRFGDWSLLTTLFHVRGVEWMASFEHAEDVSLDALLSAIAADRVGLSDRLRLAVAWQRQRSTSTITDTQATTLQTITSEAATEALSGMRVQGRTAYVAAQGQRRALDFETQAWALMALVQSGSDELMQHPLVEKLANYVAQGNAHGAGRLFVVNHRSLAIAAEALAIYDEKRGSASPDIMIVAYAAGVKKDFLLGNDADGTAGGDVVGSSSSSSSSSGSTVSLVPIATSDAALLEGRWQSPTSPMISTTTPWSAFAPSTSPTALQFRGRGRGEISIAIELGFVPRDVIPAPVYRGIYVEKSMRRVNMASGRAEGPTTQIFQRGDIVEITLQITTPDDLQQVNMIDLLPGGLEAMDPNVRSDPFTPRPPSATSSPSPPSSSFPPGVSLPPMFDDMMMEGDAMMPDGGGGRISSSASGFSSSGPSFTSSSSSSSSSSIYEPRRSTYYWRSPSWWQTFGERETLADQVRWSAAHIAAGTHSITYRTVANTLGRFTLPATKAYVEAQPEVMGLSASSMILVRDTPTPSAAVDRERILQEAGITSITASSSSTSSSTSSLPTPKECQVCDDGMTCNIQTGVCERMYAPIVAERSVLEAAVAAAAAATGTTGSDGSNGSNGGEIDVVAPPVDIVSSADITDAINIINNGNDAGNGNGNGADISAAISTTSSSSLGFFHHIIMIVIAMMMMMMM